MTKAALAEQNRIIKAIEMYFQFVAIPNATTHLTNIITTIRNTHGN